ncbi:MULTISPECIES: hypothetical protein [unclassified Methanoregula]|uniref:hypothetical protein n=1 Tax=unclassified Methanoregula TaxID=2649730 RepID=UPI0009C52F65|nr:MULTISPECIES: hypothetical protein [unclassified Methanoregula]OPX64062.1 MAG: hypothetical protein A4E33_01085 [Methanoregula sp. PtaB.Bin085]OPY33740.1 MAG: hypothetical protein A4E34_01678 [Methanoregula sp. PtaU1.Bin006]
MDKIPLETEGEESEIRFRDSFSVRYIQSAALLCRLAYAVEQEYQKAKTVTEDARLRHEAFVLNAVLSSVSFLESTVNELHADATDEEFAAADEKHGTLLRTIGRQWHNPKNFDRAPMLTKYQTILAIAGQPGFEEGDQAFVNVRELIEIRNHLLHYTREWVVIHHRRSPGREPESTSDHFERMLARKFAINPLAAENVPFFPDKCLGHGCAEWAILNCVIFVDEFYRRLGLPVPYEGIRDELLTR